MYPTPAEIRRLLNRVECAMSEEDAATLTDLIEDFSTPEATLMRKAEAMAMALERSNQIQELLIPLLQAHTAEVAKASEIREQELKLALAKHVSSTRLRETAIVKIGIPFGAALISFVLGLLTNLASWLPFTTTP